MSCRSALIVAGIGTCFAASAPLLAEMVVHDTSAEFAGGAFTDTGDSGSGAAPAIRIVYQTLPFGFGDGRDGSQSINGDPNARASCTGSAGSTTLTTSLSVSAGDIVLIHQSRGSGAGSWELNKVISAGGGSLTLTSQLQSNYVDSGASQAQVLRVPQYTNLTINGGGPASWNGDTGGLYAVMCKGTITANGTLSAYAAGFAGGAANGTNGQGYQAEGTGGGPNAQTCTRNGNGGGGGGSFGYGDVGGGGGGGYGGAGEQGGFGHGHGNPCRADGGDTIGDGTLGLVVFGGGGGGGGDKTDGGTTGCPGGRGGGSFVILGQTVAVNSSVLATGEMGAFTCGSGPGCGGSGAGGAILVRSVSASLGSNLLVATGAARASNGNDNYGGAGAAGRIRVETPAGGATGTTNPGASVGTLEFKSTGVYISPAIETPGATSLGLISWNYTGGTSVQIRTRTAATAGGLSGASWSAYLSNSAGSQMTSSPNEWVQYEAFLTGTTSDSPTLTSITLEYSITIPPSIIEDPTSQSVCGGGTAVFTVAADGDPPFDYLWQKDTIDLSEGGHYSGVNTDTLTVSNTDAGDEGSYRCIVSNDGGSDTSNDAALTVDTTDSDSDGTPDCNDDCPADPAKTSPGVCGCGNQDDDSDNDGVADCVDACPGVDDSVDANTNGTPDCAEPAPRILNYQGKLRTAGGATYEGTADVTFRIYDGDGPMAVMLFEETQVGIPVTRGLFGTLIGSQTPGGVPDSALDAMPTWLGVSINGGAELTPRTQVASTPLAVKARSAEQLVKPNTFDPAVTVYPNGYLGIGTTSPQYPLHMASGARVTPGGVWTNASSRALKHDIEPLSDAEAARLLAALDPVKFAYNAEPGTTHVGFIAEDAPGLLATPQNDGMSAMDVAAVLTRVLKQQNELVEQLRCELEAQRELIETQQRQIEAFSRHSEVGGKHRSAKADPRVPAQE